MNALHTALAKVSATDEAKMRVKALLCAETLHREQHRSPLPRLAAACACLLLALSALGAWLLYRTPVSFISIDVNPSLELRLNRFGRVVGSTAFNDGGAQVLNSISVHNLPCEDVIEALAANPLLRSSLDSGARVVFTVVSDRPEELRAMITGGKGFRACAGLYVQADASCLEQAHACGLSVGKYYVYEELSQYGSSVTIEDCHHMSIGQLQDELARCSGYGHGYGHGHGHGGHHETNHTAVK